MTRTDRIVAEAATTTMPPPARRTYRHTGMRLFMVALLTAAVALIAAPSTAYAALCGQNTHIWWATPGGSLADGSTTYVPAGSTSYATGVVSPGWPITFYAPPGFFRSVSGGGVSADGSTFTTTPSDGNCVVHHDQNIINTPDRGTFFIYADYADWNQNKTIYHAFVGTLVVY